MRRLIPRNQMGARGPLLLFSLLLLVLAFVLFGLEKDFGALTALIAAFLVVAAAKRA